MTLQNFVGDQASLNKLLEWYNTIPALLVPYIVHTAPPLTFAFVSFNFP